MGDPRKQKKKYSKPGKIWDKERIDKEKDLIKDYGLRRKKEVWRAESFLRELRRQAKSLIASKDEQAKKEGEQLISRLVRLNLIKGGAKLEDVLSLELKSVLNRRLQSFVFRKGLAKSMKQSRQFVVHGHISINNKKVNVPSYIVRGDEEEKIRFSENSNLSKDDHPEIIKEARNAKEERKKLEIEDKDAIKLFEESKEVEEEKKEEIIKEKNEVKEEKKE